MAPHNPSLRLVNKPKIRTFALLFFRFDLLFMRRQNPQQIKPYRYALLSMTLLLYLLGLFATLSIYFGGVLRELKESLQFSIELRDDATEAEVFRFQKQLEGSDFVKKGSVRYISKEEAGEQLKKELGDDVFAFGVNPLFNTLRFQMRAEYLDKETGNNFEQIVADIREKGFVADVFYMEIVAENVAGNLQNLGWLLLLLALIFALVVFALLDNTIKLLLYSNRFIIKNMELVGATRAFIAKPYLQQGLRNGLISSGIAVLLLLLTIFFLQQQVAALAGLGHPFGFTLLFLAVLGLGIALSWWSTRRAVYKYLKLRLEELY